MKKIFALAAMLLIEVSAFAGEAWNNHLGFGFRAPSGMTVSDLNDDADWKLKMPIQTGIDFTYTGVHMASGFSVRGFMDYNLSSSNIESIDPKNHTKLTGFNFDSALGLGWAPIRNKFLMLGLYGIAGVDFSIFPDTYVVKLGTSNKNDDLGTISTVVTHTYLSFFAGGNATAVWTPFGKRFSLFGSATVAYNLPGLFEVSTSTTTSSLKDDSRTVDYSDKYNASGALKIIPALGVSWRF